MSLSKSNFRNALKKVVKPQTGWLDIFPATIGRADGTILTSVRGEIYVRNILNGQILKVFNNNVAPNILNLQVEIGRRVETPGLWQVKGQRQNFSRPASAALVPYHKEQHIFPAPDAPIFPRKQIRELTVLVFDAANFIAQVYGGIIRTDFGVAIVENQTMDFSGYVPVSGAVYVSIECDVTGILSLHEGAVIASPDAVTVADVPNPSAGKYMIAFVLLYESMTALNDNLIGLPSPLVTDYSGITVNTRSKIFQLMGA